MSGIKESLEVLEGLKILVSDAKQVLADGAINLSDLPVAMELLGQLGTLTDAVQGVDQVPVEMKDLTPDEINLLVSKVLEIVAVLKA